MEELYLKMGILWLCNQLVVRSKVGEVQKIWEIGNELGVLDADSREKVEAQFDSWEKRDQDAVAGDKALKA